MLISYSIGLVAGVAITLLIVRAFVEVDDDDLNEDDRRF